jgi:hypothetical protein
MLGAGNLIQVSGLGFTVHGSRFVVDREAARVYNLDFVPLFVSRIFLVLKNINVERHSVLVFFAFRPVDQLHLHIPLSFRFYLIRLA